VVKTSKKPERKERKRGTLSESKSKKIEVLKEVEKITLTKKVYSENIERFAIQIQGNVKSKMIDYSGTKHIMSWKRRTAKRGKGGKAEGVNLVPHRQFR